MNKLNDNFLTGDADSTAPLTLAKAIEGYEFDPESITPFSELVGCTVTITSADLREGEYGDYMYITYTDENGREWATTTGASIVMRKLKIVIESNRFPVVATIGKTSNYYTLQ